MYVWGQGDGGWLGIPPPSEMPVLGEGDAPLHPITSISSEVSLLPLSASECRKAELLKQDQLQIKHSCSFDSRHNILVPERINEYFISPHYVVERVRCGGSHTVVFLGQKAGGDSVVNGEEGISSSVSVVQGTESRSGKGSTPGPSPSKGTGVIDVKSH
jgi:hypothetical protein